MILDYWSTEHDESSASIADSGLPEPTGATAAEPPTPACEHAPSLVNLVHRKIFEGQVDLG